MTVAELIEVLQTMEGDAVVVTPSHSGQAVVDVDVKLAIDGNVEIVPLDFRTAW